MKRDWRLIRKLLLEIEPTDRYSEAELIYHWWLLIDGRLADGVVTRNSAGELTSALIFRLTSKGRDFQAAMSDNRIFEAALDRFEQFGYGIPSDLLLAALQSGIEKSIGLSYGN